MPNPSIPELLVDAAVDDKVDGGVEDEEDVVGGVQVVDVGRRVESPYGKNAYNLRVQAVTDILLGRLKES